MVQVDLYGTRRRTFVDHDVDAIVLHGRVEILLHHRTQTMYLIDEKDIIGLKRCEQSCQVTWFVKNRARGHFETHAQFVGDDVTECRLTESRRAKKQHMVKALVPKLGGFDEDLEVGRHFALSRKIRKTQRPQGIVLLLLTHLLAYIKVIYHLVITIYDLRFIGSFRGTVVPNQGYCRLVRPLSLVRGPISLLGRTSRVPLA